MAAVEILALAVRLHTDDDKRGVLGSQIAYAEELVGIARDLGQRHIG